MLTIFKKAALMAAFFYAGRMAFSLLKRPVASI